MGKSDEDEFTLNNSNINSNVNNNNNGERVNGKNCFIIDKIIGVKCLLVILLGISVFLSALFWLPPFLNLSDPPDLDLDPKYRGHTIVARFTLHELASVVKDNTEKLEADIYYEIEAARTKVTILSTEAENSLGPNFTAVVFGIDPESKHTSISPTELSLIRSSFASLVTMQTNLTTTLFDEHPSDFEVLKFHGGFTIVPPHQFVFPLQNVQISFNFTLNNSIFQILRNFADLELQLKTGLHLSVSENLYIQITNFRGSTVLPPARVEAYVVQTIGVTSVPRLKQLAQTIKDSPARNLGLNNSVFGKVKQVSLSSFLQHSLNGDARSPAPAPSPLTHPHRHYHHHHHRGSYLSPSYAPSYSPREAPSQPIKSSPAPRRSAYPPVESPQVVALGAPTPLIGGYQATPPAALAPVRSRHASPPGCIFRSKNRHTGKSPVQPPISEPPIMSPHLSPVLPHRHANSPKPVGHHISPSSPLPNVIYARVPPPSETIMDPEPPDKLPSSIALSPSNGGHIWAIRWGISVLVVLLPQLW